MCTTQQHKEKNKQNDPKLPKRNPNKTNQRTTRHDNPPTPRPTTHARLPNHHKNPQNLRSILRTKHRIPTTRHPRKKRLPQKQLEHEHRKTKKNIPTHQRRPNNTQLHRRITKPNMQNNNHRQQNQNRSRTPPLISKQKRNCLSIVQPLRKGCLKLAYEEESQDRKIARSP
jgi:hypothetical protein